MGHVFMLMVPQAKGAPLKAIRVHAEKSNFIGVDVAQELKDPITHANELYSCTSLMLANSHVLHCTVLYSTCKSKVTRESFARETRTIICTPSEQ